MSENTHKVRYLSEIFDDANKSSNPIASLKDACNKEVRLPMIIGYAVNPKWKMALHLPEGSPPFRKSDLPIGMGELDVLKLHKQLYVIFNVSMKKFQKEAHFMRWLEAMHPTDAEILCAVKDQTLENLYPNLTKEVLYTTLGWSKEDYLKSF